MSTQSSHLTEWSCSWNVCRICIFNKKKGKKMWNFLDTTLVQWWNSAQKQRSARAKCWWWFRIQEFCQDDENWLWGFASENSPQNPREDRKYCEAIPASIRLTTTLRYSANSDSFTSLTYTLKISKQSVSMIVPVVCEALITALKECVMVKRKLLCTRTYLFCKILN